MKGAGETVEASGDAEKDDHERQEVGEEYELGEGGVELWQRYVNLSVR